MLQVQKTETNEKNSAKNVENTPLQLLDNERVAKASLEENSIVENSIEEIKRKEKEATASEKESSSSGSKLRLKNLLDHYGYEQGSANEL